MNILLLANRLHGGGTETVIQSVAAELVRAGHRVTLWAPEGTREELRAHYPENVEFYFIVGSDAAQSLYFIIRCLTQQDDSAQRHTHIPITRSLTTPRTPIDTGCPIREYPHYRIVVVNQLTVIDISEP